ncbi:OmpA family protein [Crocinitomicaceae bacterium]|nr:OmpA family protein [Crocinitomicaceae bacterium]
MKRKSLSFVFILSATLNCWSQDAANAENYFENFEYAQAENAYEAVRAKRNLNSEEVEKLGFCYYINGNSSEGLPYINSIITDHSDKAHFWLWKGTLEKESGNYNSAVNSLKKCMSLSYELNTEIQLMIATCNEIQTWKDTPNMSVTNSAENSRYANGSGYVNGQKIHFHEVGLDSAGNFIADPNSNVELQLMLMRPYTLTDNSMREIELFKNYRAYSINAFYIHKPSNKVIFSASRPLEQDASLAVQQIYVGTYVSLQSKLDDVTLWSYSGISDTSSCTHPTLSLDGKQMVFSKSGSNIQGSDLYRSIYKNGSWTTPVPLTELNTLGNEMYPSFLGDSLLIFSSDGRLGYGGLDVYSYAFENENIKHLKAPINSCFDDFNLFWHDTLSGSVVSNRANGKGDDDVWNIKIDPPKPTVSVPSKEFLAWMEKWNLRKIYFDFDSFTSELNAEFIEGCLKYTELYDLQMVLVGHADSRGTKAYNFKLGKNRADWLKQQLLDANVTTEIKSESLGSSALVNNCKPGVFCSEREHQLNRFVEIKLTVNYP